MKAIPFSEEQLNQFGLRPQFDSMGNGEWYLARHETPVGAVTTRGPRECAFISHEKDGWLSWVLLEWVSGDGADGIDLFDIVVHGEGSSGLRECRHTYFGDDGYIFYLDGDVLSWGIEQLRQWFDMT